MSHFHAQAPPTGPACALARNGSRFVYLLPALATLITGVLTGCGGGAAPANRATTFAVGGTVAGLTGTGLVLQENGTSDFPVSADGSFTFATPLPSGTAYRVTVKTQPSQPAQTCIPTRASGTVSNASVSTILVVCTPGGISLLAGQLGGPGNVDGPVATARFTDPAGFAVDTLGNLYTADDFGAVIRRISASGTVTTLAGTSGQYGNANGPGSAAQFNNALGVAVDPLGNIYVADRGNYTIRKITPAGVVTTFAGTTGVPGTADGAGATASFLLPSALVSDAAGNLYVTDFQPGGTAVRKITPAAMVSTFVPSTLQFTFGGIAPDRTGNLWASDSSSAIDVITPAGTVAVLAGGATGSADGTGAAAQFGGASGLAFGSDGNAYVADTNNSTIRKVTPAGVVTTIAGQAGVQGDVDGVGSTVHFNYPSTITGDSAGNLYVADPIKRLIRKVTLNGTATTAAGVADKPGFADGSGAAAQFNQPHGAAVDAAGNIFIADSLNNRIRELTLDGVVTTVAGSGMAGATDGAAATAEFNRPSGVATDAAGNIYVADNANHLIRKITADGTVMTLAGSGQSGYMDGMGVAAQFSYPSGVAVAADGAVFVADTGNNVIRRVTATGVVSTFAGVPSGVGGYRDGAASVAQFNGPAALALDASGNLFVSDSFNCVVRKVSSGGQVSTIAGQARQSGYTDGVAATSLFSSPGGMAADASGSLYVADVGNDVVRKINTLGSVSTVIGVKQSIGVALGATPGSLTTNGGIGLAFVPNSAASIVLVDTAENAVLLVNLP